MHLVGVGGAGEGGCVVAGSDIINKVVRRTAGQVYRHATSECLMGSGKNKENFFCSPKPNN